MQTEDFNYSDERFADLQLLRYRLNGFESLTPQQKELVYYLSGGLSETGVVFQWHLSSLWMREIHA